jgi:hypothetical protein
VQADVMDAGGLGDGNGVIPLTSATSASGVSGNSMKAPTWTELFNGYLAAGKVGNCAHSGSCHQNVMRSPRAAFSWLQAQGQLSGSEPGITDPTSSCFSWLGGDMPPDGPASDPIVERDFELWVKDGAKNN